jgi:hypothetical protein
MNKEELKLMLKENLRLQVEDRCAGHMCADETYLIVLFDGEPITEVRIRREECEGEW